MIRIATLAAALFVATPAIAQHYAATPATAPAKASLVTRTTVWTCKDGVCTARKANSSDKVMCELVAKQVGTLNAFRAGGETFDEARLASCNAKAQ